MSEYPNPQAHAREQDLAGRVAIITGASRGIGYAIALHLARRGAGILATSTGASTHIDKLRDEVSSAYSRSDTQRPKVVHLVLSLTDLEAHRKIANAVQSEFDGYTDIFINNAAVADRTYPAELEEETLDRILLCNIRTPAMIVDELVKRRCFRRESRIIFISSAESVNCDPSVTIYASTKAANEAMVRCYANAFGGKNPAFDFMAGSTANSVFTGLTDTSGPQQFGPKLWQELQEFWVSRQAIPRLANPDDVADVVGFLCGRDGRWVTGSKVSANGGSIAVF
ncbi:uncharacterized protein Z519_01844 [Cladophialophora bantiana CBS 173.52]|uniref:Gluconate 5-dehydrogenase n=1 Tax=Cladophialophora bantiana (strain ATCC 10958 / CBS 173.52 / CDC B-1940 / NIH 8579) TaxID=1442370 RepID=A0A0D2I4Q4_CLAB1|nr:uncharacterized protein Z519_01844 [Cladophialophora bantiana CBS 173.52]KIW98260.1 hypothetical protein Z519_01844 [Cladophialophora bantiana CBS 173.52]